MQLTGPGMVGPPRDRAEALAVLRRSVDLGVDLIDTALFYGPESVNSLIREALHPYRQEVCLATKVGARRDPAGGFRPARGAQELREDVEQNLRTLGVDCPGLVNLRQAPHHGAGTDPGGDVSMLTALETLETLRGEGKLESIGISNVERDLAEAAFDAFDIAVVQNSFSIVDRGDEPTLLLCQQRGVAYMPFFPLGSALTGGPATFANDPLIVAVAQAHGATTSQIALAWLLALDERVVLIPGTASRAHLEQNVAAGVISLSDQELNALAGVEDHGSPLAVRTQR